MGAYVLRRLVYGAGVVLGVLFLLFVLFFTITQPEDIARKALGDKVPPEAIAIWLENHGYDRPLWPWQDWDDNLLFDHYRRMLTFDFGLSDADDSPIVDRIAVGMGPSLSLTVPLLVLGLLVAIPLSLLVAFFRETYIDRMGVFLCVLAMSVYSAASGRMTRTSTRLCRHAIKSRKSMTGSAARSSSAACRSK